MFANKLQEFARKAVKVCRIDSEPIARVWHGDRHREDFSWLLKAVCDKVVERQPVARVVVAVQ